MKWYLAVMKKYAVFNGRARRKEYWMFFLWNIIIGFIIGFVLGIVGAMLQVGTALSDLAGVIYGLAVFVPGLAVAIRRMHDVGRSGWWILFPVVNLVFLCLDSKPGENEYGPNPKTT